MCVEEVACAARCSRGSVQGVLRAPAEGEGGVAHREDLAATASATLERSTGTVAHGKRAARERRRRRSPRSRAAGAPATRRRRAVGGACACRARSDGREDLVVVVVVVRTPTPNYLRQASPDRGKYTFYHYDGPSQIYTHTVWTRVGVSRVTTAGWMHGWTLHP